MLRTQHFRVFQLNAEDGGKTHRHAEEAQSTSNREENNGKTEPSRQYCG